MAFTTYTLKGGSNTVSIHSAPIEIRAIWNYGTANDINMIRIRKSKDRNEIVHGSAYFGVHVNKISAYTTTESQFVDLYFKKEVRLNHANIGMQILTIPDTFDYGQTIEDLKTVVDKMTPNWYQRLINMFDNLTYKLKA
tara:strand:+ start:157 stop:573 length:417 start_codon:yes stop_codon:yes gene_type:complete